MPPSRDDSVCAEAERGGPRCRCRNYPALESWPDHWLWLTYRERNGVRCGSAVPDDPVPALSAPGSGGARRPGPLAPGIPGTGPPALGSQPQRWDIDAAQPGQATATMAHGCGCRRNDGTSLRLPAQPEQHRWAIVAVSRVEMPGQASLPEHHLFQGFHVLIEEGRPGLGRRLLALALPQLLSEPDHSRAGRPSGPDERLRVRRSASRSRTGGGETDWTLSALQTAAASLAGPGTWLLVGIAPAGTGGVRAPVEDLAQVLGVGVPAR